MGETMYYQALTTVSTKRYEDNGRIITLPNGKKYMYCRANDAIAKGAPVSAVQPYSGGVLNTAPLRITDAASAILSNKTIGVCSEVAASTSQYVWVQIGGICNYVLTDKGVVMGDQLIKDEATAGMADTQVKSAAGTQFGWTHLGTALATDSGSVCPSVLLDSRF